MSDSELIATLQDSDDPIVRLLVQRLQVANTELDKAYNTIDELEAAG